MISTKAFKKVEWIEITLFLFLLTFLQATLYGLAVTTMYVSCPYFLTFLMLAIPYGHLCFLIYIVFELVLTALRKIAKSIELTRLPSLPKGIEVHTSIPGIIATTVCTTCHMTSCTTCHNDLIPCRYLHTFPVVVDGRCKYGRERNTRVRYDTNDETNNNKFEEGELMRRKYTKIVKILSNILRISFWLYVTYAVLMISTKSFLLPVSYVVLMISNKLITNTRLNNFNGNKLLLILLCYLVTVPNVETPKSKGRPKSSKKKGSKLSNFKPKKLDFSDHEVPTSSTVMNPPNDIIVNPLNDVITNAQNDISVPNDNEVPTSSTSINTPNEISALTTTHYRALNIDYSVISDETMNRKPIVKLENNGVNVCFLNSCCQALYSLDLFHTYLEQTTIDHPVIDKLKELFQTMRNTNGTVNTYDYMTQIQEYFNDYTLAQQYDAEECLRKILEICYPDIHNAASDNEFDSSKFDSQFIFRVTCNETVECEVNRGGCGNTQDRYEYHEILKLPVEETSVYQQSVEQLLNAANANVNPMPDYRCEIDPSRSCTQRNSCNKRSILSGFKDILVIQLKIFSHDEFGQQRKFFPDLFIDESITQFAQYKLKGIIWHHGNSIQSGHYTAMIKQRNGQWIHISDTIIDETCYPIKFHCTRDDKMVPYILFYTKDETNVSNVPLNIEESESESESVDFHINRVPKRTHDGLNDDNLNSAKRNKLDCENDVIIDTEETFIEIDDEPEESVEDENVEKSTKRKFNFHKKKAKFSHIQKKLENNRYLKREKRSTPQGKKEYNEYQKFNS